MQQYILRRLLLTIPVLWLVSFVVFSLVRLLPGDAVMAMIGETAQYTDVELAQFRHELGLDRPFLEQYITWLGGALRGDLGVSVKSRFPVAQELLKALPITIEIAVLAIFSAIIIALPVGIISATRRDTWADYLGRLFAIGGLSMPDFWIATMFILGASLLFRWTTPLRYTSFFDDPLTNLQQFLVPSLILGLRLSAVTMRMTRSSLLEVLRQDYIRTAWAKGLRERAVIWRHALKNAMIPVITIIGDQFGRLLGGTVIIETVFSLPGVGRLTVNAILQRDYPQIQGNVLFLALVMVTMNLLVDLTYAWFDPRIRYR